MTLEDLASLASPELGLFKFVGKLIGKGVDEVVKNKTHYKDMLQFNACNGFSSNKEYRTIALQDLPPEIVRWLAGIQTTRFKYQSYAEIFQALGTRPTRTCACSPLEAKWVYTYFKKYRTWDYNPRNTVTQYELCAPLSSADWQEYNSIL